MSHFYGSLCTISSEHEVNRALLRYSPTKMRVWWPSKPQSTFQSLFCRLAQESTQLVIINAKTEQFQNHGSSEVFGTVSPSLKHITTES